MKRIIQRFNKYSLIFLGIALLISIDIKSQDSGNSLHFDGWMIM